MPTTKTAEKEMRTAERRKARNKSVRGRTKTRITTAEQSIAAGNLEGADSAVKAAISSLDKEAGKGIEHRNNAGRRKSRLVKKLNKLAASAAKSEKK